MECFEKSNIALINSRYNELSTRYINKAEENNEFIKLLIKEYHESKNSIIKKYSDLTPITYIDNLCNESAP